jgi:hypothetical protein
MGQTLLLEQLGIKRYFSNISSHLKAHFRNDSGSAHEAVQLAKQIARHIKTDIF